MPARASDVPDSLAGARVDDRVLSLLSATSGVLAFNGIRRALRVHPESLSRALRRLEREGTIRREATGYSLREPAPNARGWDESVSRVPIASVRLPPEVSREELFGLLAGRWFGDLRWLGLYERPRDTWLVWSLPSAGRVIVRFEGPVLVVEANPTEDGASIDRLGNAARDLLASGLQRLHALERRPLPFAPPGLLDEEDGPEGVTEFRLDRSISATAG